MFSGIVERMAEVVDIRTDRQNKDFTLRADFCRELKIDQSIACLLYTSPSPRDA